ncbi:hypothetical protein EV421DRAFT_1932074, partial [Armillaria borealis]
MVFVLTTSSYSSILSFFSFASCIDCSLCPMPDGKRPILTTNGSRCYLGPCTTRNSLMRPIGPRHRRVRSCLHFNRSSNVDLAARRSISTALHLDSMSRGVHGVTSFRSLFVSIFQSSQIHVAPRGSTLCLSLNRLESWKSLNSATSGGRGRTSTLSTIKALRFIPNIGTT